MGDRHGEIHWNELQTADIDKALAFYRGVLGWRIEEMQMGEAEPYRLAWAGETQVGGLWAMTGPDFAGMPDAWITYFAVDDVDAAAKAVPETGGRVLRAPFDVPGIGRILVAEDAGGAVIGLMTPASRAAV